MSVIFFGLGMGYLIGMLFVFIVRVYESLDEIEEKVKSYYPRYLFALQTHFLKTVFWSMVVWMLISYISFRVYTFFY